LDIFGSVEGQHEYRQWFFGFPFEDIYRFEDVISLLAQFLDYLFRITGSS